MVSLALSCPSGILCNTIMLPTRDCENHQFIKSGHQLTLLILATCRMTIHWSPCSSLLILASICHMRYIPPRFNDRVPNVWLIIVVRGRPSNSATMSSCEGYRCCIVTICVAYGLNRCAPTGIMSCRIRENFNM